MATQDMNHPESAGPGYTPSTKTNKSFEDQAQHARDFADKAKDTAERTLGSSTPSTPQRSGASTTPTSGSGSFGSSSPVGAADRPGRTGGDTLRKDTTGASEGTSKMDQATTKAKEMVDDLRAKDPAEMATMARDKATELGDQARDKAAEFGTQARDKAAAFGDQAYGRVDSATTAAGQRMEDMAQMLRDRAPEGRMGELAMGAADALKRGGDYLEHANPEMMRGDLEDLIRRYPMHSLAIGFGLGFLLARAFRR
jgi:hypothetical protein